MQQYLRHDDVVRLRDATPDAYDISQFVIDFDHQQAICPNAKASDAWRESVTPTGLPVVQIAFQRHDCATCADRCRCTRTKENPRGITIRPKEQFHAQQHIRTEQTTPPGASPMLYVPQWKDSSPKHRPAATYTTPATAARPRHSCNTSSPPWRST